MKTPTEIEAKLTELGNLMRQAIRLHYNILKAWGDWLQMTRKQQEVKNYVQGNTVPPAPGRPGGDGKRSGGSPGNSAKPGT